MPHRTENTRDVVCDREWIPALDGLRGFACLAVIGSHIELRGMDGGWLGVDLFFVLSGYLITGILLHERDRTGSLRLGPFYARRSARLYPALLVAVGLHLALNAKSSDQRGIWLATAQALSYTTDLYRNHPVGILHHTWSLGIEEQFYLAWPILLIVAITAGRRYVACAALATGMTSLLAMLAAPPAAGDITHAYYHPQTRVWELLAGCALAAFNPSIGRKASASAGWIGAALIAAAGAAGATVVSRMTAPPMTADCAAAVVGTLLVIVAAKDGHGRVARMLSVRPARWLGDHSYGMYLYHLAAIYLVTTTMHTRRLLHAPAILALTAAAAWLSRRRIELPVQRRVRAWLRARDLPAGSSGRTDELTIA